VRPWLLRDVWSYLTTGVVAAEPTVEEKCGMIRQHFAGIARYRNTEGEGEHIAACMFRKRISWYARTMHPCRGLKDEMREISTDVDMENAFAAVFGVAAAV